MRDQKTRNRMMRNFHLIDDIRNEAWKKEGEGSIIKKNKCKGLMQESILVVIIVLFAPRRLCAFFPPTSTYY